MPIIRRTSPTAKVIANVFRESSIKDTKLTEEPLPGLRTTYERGVAIRMKSPAEVAPFI